MKRKIALALVFSMTATLLAGCSSNNTSENTSGNNATSTESSEDSNSIVEATLKANYSGVLEENCTLHILENDTAKKQGYLQELLDAFNKAYKDYGIEAVDANVGEYTDLTQNGEAGYGPDVLYQANDQLMKYVDGQYIRPIPVEQLECYQYISQNAWDAFTTEENGGTFTMAVPVNVQTPMLFYRKDMLPENWESEWDDDQNGVPDMVESWNTLYAYSQSIIDQGEGNFGYMRSLGTPYPASGFLFSYGAYIFGDNNTNADDIGFASGNAVKGASILSQFAQIMNQECTDESITANAYNKLAQGIYFATMTTPDTYTLFIDELTDAYEEEGLSEEEAEAKAYENLVMTTVPMLPESGDLTEENPELFEMTEMGGINGYAISIYTEYPNAALAFVDFATSYEMIMKRNEMLGIVPARKDAAEVVGDVCEAVFEKLDDGHIVVMPSISEVAQIWAPMQTLFIDIATDAFRDNSEKKYTDQASMQEGLEKMVQDIKDAINTLASNE